MNELERLERELLESLSRGDLDAAGTLLRDDFLITTAGWIAEPAGKHSRPTNTFTSDDLAVDKMTFQAYATIVGAQDAFMSDNTATSLVVQVTR